MVHDHDTRDAIARAALHSRMLAARAEKDAATSSLYADMEAEARSWQLLRFAFWIAAAFLVFLIGAVVLS